MPDRPNIVLICVDQMRYDCLSVLHHPAVETPHLDYLADRGVIFTNAYTGVASCIGARAALFTGLTQRSHGRVGYRDGVTWRYDATLAGELTKAGYQTVAVGKMHVHPQRNKVGFEEVVLHDGMLHHYARDRENDYEDWLRREAGEDCGLFDHGLASNSWVARPWHLPEYMHPTYWVVSRSVEFLWRRDQSRPFFLFMSFVAPHPPLVPPQCYFDQYLNQKLPEPPVGDWIEKTGFERMYSRWDHNTSFAKLDARAQHRAQAGYYGLITQIDHQIGRFLEHCSDHRVSNNTIFLFVSDHGEMLGDHHCFRKGVPYAGSVRVPLIASFPKGFGVEPGQSLNHLAELRDITPTILDAAGVRIPPSVEGLSLLPLMKKQEIEWRSHLHGEHWGTAANHYIADGRFKYAWYSQSGVEHLFDTEGDPQEVHDLIDESKHKATVERLRGLLIEELTPREEGYADGKKLIVGQQGGPVLSHILGQV